MAVCGCAARDACRIVAENIPTTTDVRTELVKSFGIKAYACHPLMEQNRVLGTLSFGTRFRTTFSTDDLAMMKAVADQVAIAMGRVRTEQALQESESVLRAFFDSPGMLRGVVEVAGGDIRYVSANAAAAAAYGLTPEAMHGKLISELGTPPEIVQVYLERCEESRGKGVAVSFEVFRRLAGGDRWLLVTANHLGSGLAGASRFGFVMLDITESKRAEEALRVNGKFIKAESDTAAGRRNEPR
jgi:PAS domain S-box-containing protein